ncbi:MAG: phosphoglycerate kinase [Planctomycetota bacterium]|nr:MAG: phosphoglycerate kinase [Planctomycetota bacterium]
MPGKLTIRDVDARGKRVFVRVDFNVPLDGGRVGDDTRIRESVPTLQALLDAGAGLVIGTHLGRPKGAPEDKYRLAPVAARAGELLGRKLTYVRDVVGPEAQAAAGSLRPGEVLLLENLRFEPGEEKNDEAFAAQLAAFADMFVQDAFGTCHRAHASTSALPKVLKPAVAGLLLHKEIEAFHTVMEAPRRPVVAITGGAKVSDKIPVLKNLVGKVQVILVGGGMAYTFLKAQGREIGSSLFEADSLAKARDILEKAKYHGVKLLLPVDHVIADQFAEKANIKVVEDDIPAGWMGLDIGPKTVLAYQSHIAGAGTIVWNGPMGVFEMKHFRNGTLAIAKAVASSKAVSVVGGGDSVAALQMSGVAGKITHISTGGGAFLEMLEGKDMPGIAALDDAKLPAEA